MKKYDNSLNAKRTIALLMPTRDGQLSLETHTSISMNCDGFTFVDVATSRLDIVSARNELARRVIEERNRFSGLTYALFVDNDAWWPPGTIVAVHTAMESNPSIDVMASYFSDRMPFFPAGAFPKLGVPSAILPENVDLPQDLNLDIVRFSLGDIVEVKAVAFHFVMVRISLLERLGACPFSVSTDAVYGEDIVFCERVGAIGGRIACHTGALVGHVDIETGFVFFPLSPPCRIVGDAVVRCDDRPRQQIWAEWWARDIHANRPYGIAVEAAHNRMKMTYGNVWGWKPAAQ